MNTQESGPSIAIGAPSDFGEFPASLTVEGAPYWLVRRENGGYHLFSALCPHAGGDVSPHGDIFFCPLHFWTFEQYDGVCQSVPGERLLQRKVEVGEDGKLYAVGEDY